MEPSTTPLYLSWNAAQCQSYIHTSIIRMHTTPFADWTMQWFNCTLKVCVHMLTLVYRVWHVRKAISTTQGHVHCNRSCPCSNRLGMPTFITGIPFSCLYQVHNTPTHSHIFVQIAACSSENNSGSTAECTFLLLHIHHRNCIQCNEVYVWCYLTRSGKACRRIDCEQLCKSIN